MLILVGCFCVFNSTASLEFVRHSLEKTILSDLARDDRLPFQGLPIVLVLAHEAALSEKGLMSLRDEGQSLADRYTIAERDAAVNVFPQSPEAGFYFCCT